MTVQNASKILAFVVAPALVFAVSFQNCSEVEFVQGASLVPKVEDDLGAGLDTPDLGDDDSSMNDSDQAGDNNDANNDHNDNNNDDSNNDANNDYNDNNNNNDANNDYDDKKPNRPEIPGKRPDRPERPVVGHPGVGGKSGQHQFICILDGPGKSVRLGYTDNALKANGRTPNTVCMSQSACLDLVSQKFVVKSAERRGFCKPGSPRAHTVEMTDEQVSALLGL